MISFLPGPVSWQRDYGWQGAGIPQALRLWGPHSSCSPEPSGASRGLWAGKAVWRRPVALRLATERQNQAEELLGPWTGVAGGVGEGGLSLCWKLCAAQCRPCSPAPFHEPHVPAFYPKGRKDTWLTPRQSSLPTCPPGWRTPLPAAPDGLPTGSPVACTLAPTLRAGAACGCPTRHLWAPRGRTGRRWSRKRSQALLTC